MCLSPKSIVNRHYVKVAGSLTGAFEVFRNAPDFFVKVDCGLCIDCLRKVGMHWRTRLLDEYHYWCRDDKRSKVHFVTLTIAPEFYAAVKRSPQAYIRRFFERYRKRYGVSFRHYLCSEYGEKRGRLHFHMISFGMLCDITELRKLWKYGRVDMSVLQGPQGANYVSSYVTKGVVKYFIDKSEKTFRLVSPGIGLRYCLDPANRSFHYQNGKPVFLRFRQNGSPFAVPRYYLDKIFSPIDLHRRRSLYLSQQNQLPSTPLMANRRLFDSVASYFQYLHSVGGAPCLFINQFAQLTPREQNAYFYGK